MTALSAVAAGSIVSFAWALSPIAISAETLEEQRVRLEQELATIEADIAAKRGVLQEKQKERTTLERDVGILNTKIDQAQLSIKHTDLSLKKLRSDIADKTDAINILNEKVLRSRASLAQLIRRTNEVDETTFVELTLGGTISEMLDDIDNFNAIERSLDTAFEEMALLKSDLSARKKTLEEKRVEEEDLRKIQVLEKQSVERNKKEKDQILTVTKGQEKEYQKVIAEREKNAAEIRAALFSLRDSAAINFGDAYRYAKEASAITGVRPAVVLGIIAEESNLGENVGTGTWTVDMHPDRDRPVFAQITAELGLDPNQMPVSKKAWYGWGGAMGPAQFIPSTWALYKDRVAKITGQNPPNPWDARTAIYASSLLMADNGADAQTRAAERLAALRYLAGWKNAKKSAYAFYGDDVMELADKFQRQIDILEG